jgi:uncharacterized membrane protein (UPF0127 family)
MIAHGGTGRRAARAAALVVVLLVAATSCSDDGGSGGASGGATTTESTVPPPAAEPEGPTGAMSLDDLKTATGDAPAVQESDVEVTEGPTGPAPVDNVGETVITITDAAGNVTACCVMVAASPAQRERGLMEVTELSGYRGMLFVWDADTGGGFWMRDTPTPLSIAWYAADGSFVSSAEMAPCEDSDLCPTYYPAGDYRFALETFQGDLATMGAGPGSKLTVGGDCPAT